MLLMALVKLRLSREFKQLIAPKEHVPEQEGESDIKILYYNAFYGRLILWDNDLEADSTEN